MSDLAQSLIGVFLRWSHVVFGIIWLGQLYFFNLVNVPFQRDLDEAHKAHVNPRLLLRVHYWFRMGAMYTFVFGWALFGFKYGHQVLLFEDGALSNRGAWILFGSLLATVMWFNVWFVIWPRQRALLHGLLAGKLPDDAPRLARVAGLASRFNLFASGPMLFGMIVPNNYPWLSPWWMLAAIAVGAGFWLGNVKRSFKVKTTP